MIKPMIEDSVLIQIDGTIIAGLLVLLSISMIWQANSDKPLKPITTIIKNHGFYLTPKHIFFLVVPFALSALFLLAESELEKDLRIFSIGLMATGFLLFVLIAGIIAFSEKKKDLDFS